ncbi:MAG: ATP-binding protein [Bacteroidaceae bacterium]|nr:ATP-binding protein [Bacteroidaceae bacterium]
MKKYADYITQIEIDSLWSGRHHIVWKLRPDVNILSGVNGMGKSTILNRAVRELLETVDPKWKIDGVTITYSPADAESVRFDVIRAIDRAVVSSELLSKITDHKLQTELDLQLYTLQRRYLDYQVNLSRRMIDLLTTGSPEAQAQASEIMKEKGHFQDTIDLLFRDTGKTIVRDSNEIQFRQYGEVLEPYQLSSGEKQMLIILLTVLVQNHEPYVLFMDEPEISLHFEWQKQLISLVRDLNPNAQIILTTHSPAVVMNGWQDCITDVEDIIVEN